MLPLRLSVLIPVRNQDARPFVRQLLGLAARSAVSVEFIVADDASLPKWQRVNCSLRRQGVQVMALEENVGRAKVRNLLAKVAQCEWLLFADADSAVRYPDFFERYVRAAHRAQVVVGGTIYQQAPPDDPALWLRWHYGRRREQVPVVMRRRKPWDSFRTHNFLIQRELFFQIGGFDERLQGYGHEDTLFGESLRDHKVQVCHIDNPLYHLGLEPADVFLRKTREAIANLVTLEQMGIPIRTRLQRQAAQWSWLTAIFPLRTIESLATVLEQQLCGRTTIPLWCLDLYKWLIYLKEKNKDGSQEPSSVYKHHP